MQVHPHPRCSIITRIFIHGTVILIPHNKPKDSSSELHTIFQKIPIEWLEKALQILDELSVKEFSKFDENLDIFVIDGSALTGETLVRSLRNRFSIQKYKNVATKTTSNLSL